MSAPHPYRTGFALMLLALAGFSLMDAMGSYATRTLGHSIQQTLVIAIAASLLPVLAAVHWQGQWRALKPRQPLWLGLRALFAIAEIWLVYQTLTRLPLAECYTLFFTMPFWVALLGWPLLGEKLNRLQGLALALGFVGVLVAIRPELGPLSIGQLCGLGAALFIAGGYLLMRRLSASEHPATLVLTYLLGVGLFNLTTMPGWQAVPFSHLLLIAAGGLALGMGNLLLLYALRITPAPVLAPLQYSQILWGAFYGWLLFGNWPEPHIALGALVIAGAGWLLVRKSGTPHPAE